MPSGRIRRLLLVGALLLAPVAAQEPTGCFDEAGYDEATRTILCDCGCHPQSVHDCACGRAAEMREEIRATMAEQCLSGDELIALYVERYGEQIRIAPVASGFNLIAWIGPFLALSAAAVVLLLVLRRWSRSRAVPSEPLPAPPAPDDRYADRLRDALEKFE